jgi:hypothetical protein
MGWWARSSYSTRDDNGSGLARVEQLSVHQQRDVGRNSYPYLYQWVEIYTRTHTRRVSDGYQVTVGFIISHVKPYQNN